MGRLTRRRIRYPISWWYRGHLGGRRPTGRLYSGFVAGSGGTASGLAWRILESGYTLEIPRMFAALAPLAAAGVLLWAALSGLSWLLLHGWHESAVRREG